MKTVLIGAGCIGGTIAAIATEKGFGIDVVTSNEESAALLREEGFILTGALGDHTVKLNAIGGADKLSGGYDICFIATKYQQMPDVARSVLPHLKDDALVVSLQNGICIDTLADIVGKDRAVGCMIGFGATKHGANKVEMTSLGEFYIGMLDNRRPDKLEYVKNILSCVLPTEISDNIRGRLFSKLIINSNINALSGITGKPLGQLVDDRTACRIFLKVAREGMAVAKKMGLKVPKYGKFLEYRMLSLGDNRIYNFMCENTVILVSKLKYKDVRPSTLQSLEAGLKTEIDIMNGLISKFGKEYSVPTPINDRLTQMIKEIENGERKISPENLREFDR